MLGSYRAQEWVLPRVLLAPALLALLLILVGPMLSVLRISFHSWTLTRPDLGTPFVGLDNYARALGDPAILNSFKITTVFVVAAVALEAVFGLAVALLLNVDARGMGVIRALVLLPMMLPEVVVGLMWRLILDARYGILNYFLSVLGIPTQIWLGVDWALASVVTVEVWQNTPFVVLVLLAGLRAMPQEMFEAARIDGASWWSELRHVTLPLLRPVILVALVFRTIIAMRVFVPVWVLTGGGPADTTTTFSIRLYQEAFSFYRIGYASALSWLLLLVTLVLVAVYMRVLYRERVD